jgi:thiopeptide-type bacteriocin biosynthesis protein
MDYKFYGKLAVRFPVFPLNNLFGEFLPELLHTEKFKEAIFIASPDFAYEFFKNNGPASDKLMESALKYFNRMSFRCTPFGLFSVCAMAEWNKVTAIHPDENSFYRRTRLDKEFLGKLTSQLNYTDAIFKHLKISMNNTVYKVDHKLRLIERSITNNELSITSFTANETLEFFAQLIATEKGTVADVVRKASLSGIPAKRSFNYLKTLRDNQIITTNLDTGIPAGELLNRWIEILSNIPSRKSRQLIFWLNYLSGLRNALVKIDKNATSGTDKYESLFALVTAAGSDQSLNKIIQVDLGHTGSVGSLSTRLQKSLFKGIDILQKINTDAENNQALGNFKRKFFKKYEFREVPLLIALDPELGIDYYETHTLQDEFLSSEIGIETPNGDQETVLPAYNHKLIIKLYEQAIRNGLDVIKLDDEDLSAFENGELNLPATASVFFRLLDDQHILLEHVGGSSGLNLIGRFTDFNSELKSMALDLAEHEQRLAEPSILAEVVHEPKPRSGNVTAISSVRAFEIPYFTQSGLPDDRQLMLEDLYLFLHQGEFHLRSKKHNRLVIPKISNAYNYRKASPIFKFLGDLQSQSDQSLSFDFKKLIPGRLFYPRLVYKNIVLAPATWLIAIENAKLPGGPSIDQEIRAYLRELKVPDRFILVEGDNELLIDLNQQWLLGLLTQLFIKRKNLQIKEFLFYEANYSVQVQDQAVNNQMVAFLQKNQEQRDQSKHIPLPVAEKSTIRRTFPLGSEWLFYKIYCGIISSDSLLPEVLLPLILSLKKAKLIGDTFFVRYFDPEPHIRLRFRLKDPQRLFETIDLINQALLKPTESGSVWQSQTENYIRELERYDGVMTQSEKLFCADSMYVLKLLSIPLIKDHIHNRIAAGIRLTLDLLNSSGLTAGQMLLLTENSKTALKKDCNITLFSEKKINHNYRNHLSNYQSFLLSPPDPVRTLFIKRAATMKRLFKPIRSIINSPASVLTMENLLSSYIHMTINRLFSNHQKVYELIIYDYLFRQLSREAKNINTTKN